MGGLGDHAGEMIYILLAVLLIVAVMMIVMTLAKTAKSSTNTKTAELGQQVADVDNQFFEDHDMGSCNGSQLKQFMKNAANKDCAVLVQTLALAGNEPIWKDVVTGGAAATLPTTGGETVIAGITSQTVAGGVFNSGAGSKETTFNGNAFADSVTRLLPVTMIDFVDGNAVGSHKSGIDLQVGLNVDGGKLAADADEDAGLGLGGTFITATALKTSLYNPVLVNYGTILKNSVSESGTSGEKYTSIISSRQGNVGVQATTGISAYAWDVPGVDNAQTIAYLDGRFHTKQEFAVSQAGINLRYDNTTDTQQAGKTMYIDDNAKFNSYVLVDGAGKYKGVVFIEKK